MKVLKMKLDENGHVVVQDGKPVFIYEDGKEAAFDVNAAMQKINELNEEAKNHRLAAKEATEKVAQYKDAEGKFIDPDLARNAIETVKNYTDKEMFDATQVESIKAQMNKAYTDKMEEMKRGHKAEMDSMGNAISKKDAAIFKMLVNDRFYTSPFVTNKLVIPPEIAADYFGRHFKVETGENENLKVVGYLDNEKILSRVRPGTPADFEEAIESIVDNYKMKDRIMKGSGTGSGSSGNAAGAGNYGKSAELASLPPIERMKAVRRLEAASQGK